MPILLVWVIFVRFRGGNHVVNNYPTGHSRKDCRSPGDLPSFPTTCGLLSLCSHFQMICCLSWVICGLLSVFCGSFDVSVICNLFLSDLRWLQGELQSSPGDLWSSVSDHCSSFKWPVVFSRDLRWFRCDLQYSGRPFVQNVQTCKKRTHIVDIIYGYDG